MRKKEILIIAIIAVLCAVAIFATNFFKDQSGFRSVVIKVDDKIVKNIPLSEETNETFTLETDHGYNIITVTYEEVFVVEADCPDQVCVKTTPAKDNGDIIVCLPHKMIIEIK